MNAVSLNFIISVISRLITGGINVYLISFLTQALSQSGYGEYSLIFAYLAIFLALTDLGLYSFLIRKISQEPEDESKIIGNVLTLRLFSNFFFIGVALALLFVMPYSYNVKLGITLGSVFLIATSLSQILTAVYQKYLKMTQLAVIDVVFRIIYLISVFIIYNFKNDILLYVVSLSFIELLHLLALFLWARKITPIKLDISPQVWKNSIIESYPIAVSLFFVLLYFKFDTILLSFYRPPEDVAVYSLGYKILEAIIFFPAMFIGIVMPHISRAYAKSKEDAKKISFVIWDYLWVATIPTSFFVFAYAAEIIAIFTSDYFFGADMVLKVLALSMIPIFLGNLGGNALIAAHLQKKAMKIYALAAVFNIIGNLVFMPNYGYYSAAIMTLLTETMVTFLMFIVISKYLNTLLPIGKLSIIVALNAILIGLIYSFGISLWWGVLVYLIFYPPILFILKIVNRKDIIDVFESR